MMKAVMVFVLFALLASRDFPRLIRNKKYRKELLVYSLLMLAGFSLSLLAAFHIYLPIWVQK